MIGFEATTTEYVGDKGVDIELEVKSLQDLQIINEAKKWKIKLAVIGGYAVKAYNPCGLNVTKLLSVVTVPLDLWCLRKPLG